MEETTQFNIRLPKALLYDMEYIAQNLKISRNDWLKFKIAELVSNEKLKLMENIERQFIRGTITELEFKEKAGFSPTKEMLDLKRTYTAAARKGTLAAEKYVRDIVKEINTRSK